jgi:membrane protease YdiL (CAAX protease family)
MNSKTVLWIAITLAVTLALNVMNLVTNDGLWIELAAWTPALTLAILGRRGFSVLKKLKQVRPLWLLIAVLAAILPFFLRQMTLWIFGLGTINQEIVDFGYVMFLFVRSVQGMLLLYLPQELGWRGFLQSEVDQKYGSLAGALIVAALFVTGCLPWIVKILVNSQSITAMLSYVLSLFVFSLGTSWIWQRSNSVWASALFMAVGQALAPRPLIKAINMSMGEATNTAYTVFFAVILVYLLQKGQHRREALQR